jgi:hypothetical protein
MTLTPRSGGFALEVKVVPGASRQRVMGQYGAGIKVTVTAAPEAGAANAAVIALLAEVLQIPRTNISITRGQSNPRKEVLIMSVSAELIRQRLLGADQ